MINKVKFNNLKCTGEEEYDISARTLLLGPNASGKTKIFEAIGIALEGKTTGKGNEIADIMKMSPVDSLEVEVFASVGNEAMDVKRTFTSKDGKNSQTICIDSKKRKIQEAESRIDEWYSALPQRINIKRFIDMAQRDRAKFLFSLFSDKMKTLNTLDIRDRLLWLIIREEEEMLGLLRFVYKKEEKDLTDNERTSLIADTLKEMDKRPLVKANYLAVEKVIIDVNTKQPVHEYIDALCESIRDLANKTDKSRKSTQESVKKIMLEVNGDLDIEAEEKKKEKLQKKVEKLNTLIDKYDAYMVSLQNYELAVQSIKNLRTEVTGDLNKMDVDLQTAESEKATLVRNKNEVSKQQRDNQIISSNLKNIITDIEFDVETISKKDEILQKMGIEKANLKKNDTKELKKEIEELKTKVKAKILKRDKSPVSSIYAEIMVAERLLKTMREKSECPTCGTPWDKTAFSEDSTISYLKELKKKHEEGSLELSETMKEIAEINTAISDKAISVAVKDVEYINIVAQIKDLEKQLNNIAKLQKKPELKKLNDHKKEYIRITSLLESTPGIIQDCTNAISRTEKYIGDIETAIKNHKTAIKNNKKADESEKSLKKPKNIEHPGEDVVAERNSLKDEISQIDENIKIFSENSGQIKLADKWKMEILNLTSKWKYAKKCLGTAIDVKDELTASILMPAIKKAQTILKPVIGGDVILNTTQCGIQDQKVFKDISALSGGEAILFTSAIIASLMINANINEKILLIEAGELDDENLVSIMKSLNNVKELDNVFVAYPRKEVYIKGKPFDCSSIGWDVIRMKKITSCK